MDWVTKKFSKLTPSKNSLSIFGVLRKGYLFENPIASKGWSSVKMNKKFGLFSDLFF